MTKGVDLFARYQSAANLSLAAKDISFAWVKLSDGGGVASSPGDGLVSRAHTAYIAVGGYHYAQLTPSPERQADVLIGEVNRLGATGLVPMLDMELPFQPDNVARAFGIRFCKHVATLGFRPGVYMNNAYARALRPDLWDVPGLVIWIARYGALPDASAGRYDVHQYTDKGTVPGISGGVDLNWAYTTNHYGARISEAIDLTPDEHNALISLRDNIYFGGGDRSRFDDVADRVKWMADTLGNTPDKGALSLADYRQRIEDLTEQIPGIQQSVTDLATVVAAIAAKVGVTTSEGGK
jgi:GH25 family lysozyme M1 (1,4-beta-N-acetylmuramidase)